MDDRYSFQKRIDIKNFVSLYVLNLRMIGCAYKDSLKESPVLKEIIKLLKLKCNEI